MISSRKFLRCLFRFQLLRLSLELCDNLLTFVGSLCQLFLNIFMQRNVSFECLNLFGHLIVFDHESLGVFVLVIELSRQLMVLQYGQSRLRLQLLIIQSHQIGLRLLDFILHFLFEFFDCINFLSFLVIFFIFAIFVDCCW